MDCCSNTINGLDDVFNETYARQDAKHYRKKGLDKRARLIAEEIKVRGIQGSAVLEVGSGVGGLLLELLKAGAARAVGLELSSASIAAARDLAAELGLAERVEYLSQNIAMEGSAVEAADVVILDRVVCCYPHMRPLLSEAAAHARRLLALAYPRRAWHMRAGHLALNFFSWLFREEYRFYLHSPAEIAAVVEAAGLRRTFHQRGWIWHVAIYERPPSET